MKRKFLSMLLVAGTLCALSSCGAKDAQTQQGAPAPEIAVLTIEPSTAEFQNSYPATIKGKTDIAIRPQVTGFITKVHVDEGQHVRQGQTLYRSSAISRSGRTSQG